MKVAEQNSSTALQHLISVCRQAEVGLIYAASRAQRSGLKKFLGEEALQRTVFIAELQLEVRKLGEAAKAATYSLSLPGWKEFTPYLVLQSASPDQTLLRLCDEGGRSVLDEYDRILNGNLPAPALQLVERQREHLQRAQDRLIKVQIELQNVERAPTRKQNSRRSNPLVIERKHPH